MPYIILGRAMQVLEKINASTNLGLYIYITGSIIIIGEALWNYKSTGAFWTPRVKQAYFRFFLIGKLPWIIMCCLLVLDSAYSAYTEELLVIVLYYTGITAILLRKYVLVFLQELDKMPNYPRSEYQLQVFNEIKDHKILYFAITIYFFIMGTLALFACIK